MCLFKVLLGRLVMHTTYMCKCAHTHEPDVIYGEPSVLQRLGYVFLHFSHLAKLLDDYYGQELSQAIYKYCFIKLL